MKEVYTPPEMEIVEFPERDIILTSGENRGEYENETDIDP